MNRRIIWIWNPLMHWLKHCILFLARYYLSAITVILLIILQHAYLPYPNIIVSEIIWVIIMITCLNLVKIIWREVNEEFYMTNQLHPDPDTLYPIENVTRTVFLKNIISHPQIKIGDYTYYDDPQDMHSFQ